jgi:SAM-dependent methyltransferase
MQDESELSRRVGRAFLEIEGLADGFIETIHPADEMFLTARLAEAVQPGRSRLQYYRDGREVVRSLHNLLETAGRTLGGCGRVLEMACGYGRVTRHLVRELPPECITAAEILEPAVGFVGETLGVDARLSCTDPSAFHVGSGFDLILVSSLFSHLPRSRFGEWLEVLYEALDPQGLLVFSTHGQGVIPEISKDPGGFTFVPQSESLGLEATEYGSTFVSPEVVAEIAQEHGLAHLTSLERELWMLQDLYVASPSPMRGMEAWRNASFVQGVVDRVLVRDGEFHIDGWAADTRRDMPMRCVRLLIDGAEVATVAVDKPRADVARGKGREDWLYSGWALHGRMPELPHGAHLLAAQGVSASGATGVIDILPVPMTDPA